MENQVREKQIYKTTIIGGVANVLLLLFKFVAGIVAGSSAMIADAVHSLSDFLTDIVVLVFVGISNKPEDKDHEYGHGKYETFAALIIGVVLLGVAIGIIYSGAHKVLMWLRGENLPSPGVIALWAAIASIIVKELIYRYTVSVSRKIDSPALKANAWHHRSDALSSVGTALGIGGAIFIGDRWTVLDPVAGVIVGVLIVAVSAKMIYENTQELLDRALPTNIEDQILEIVKTYPTVGDPHHLRTRRIGSHYSIDLHLRMDGQASLKTAHDTASEIEKNFKGKFGEKTIVNLHMEPYKH